MRLASILGCGVLVALLACDLPFSSSSGEAVEVRLEADGLAIRNNSQEPVFYIVMDASFAARALWAACVDPQCPSVAAGGSVLVDSTRIGGWRESDQLVVYWWRRVPAAAGGFQADSIRFIGVQY